MKIRAALLNEAPGDWSVEEVDLDGPGESEVVVRMVAAGLCHTDEHRLTTDMPSEHLPFCGGHEGAGVVEEVGAAVRSLKVGDKIVTSFIPSCGHCRWCASGLQNLCDNGAMQGSGKQLDGTYRMWRGGQPVARSSGIGGFAEYGVLSEWSCIKVPKHTDLRVAALLGCGVPTGWGSAVNGAEVQPGDVVIVMGVGGIGINSVQGAHHAGARRVIAVDPVALKREVALKLGATDAFDGIEEAGELAKSLTNGQGADSAIIATGVLTGEQLADAFRAIRKGGIVVAVAVANYRAVGIPVNLLELTLWQKRIQGSLYGLMSPARDVPMLLDLYAAGRLKLDELVTRTYTLEQINEGYDDLRAGRNIRGIIEYSS